MLLAGHQFLNRDGAPEARSVPNLTPLSNAVAVVAVVEIVSTSDPGAGADDLRASDGSGNGRPNRRGWKSAM